MLRLVSLAALSAGAVSLRTKATPQARDSNALTGYVRYERADPKLQLDMLFAVKTTELADDLEAVLYEVSSPMSPTYGQHLSKEAAEEMLAAAPVSISAVSDWLSANGISGEVAANGFIRARISIAEAEALLSTHYYRYEHPTAGSVHRCASYSLPAEVAEHIDVVAPTTQFPAPRALSSVGAAASGSGVTPDVIRTIYGVGNATATNSASRQIAAGFLQQYMSTGDLASFVTQFDPTLPAAAPHIVGPNDPTNPGLEASLDIQYIMSMGRGVDSTFWCVLARL